MNNIRIKLTAATFIAIFSTGSVGTASLVLAEMKSPASTPVMLGSTPSKDGHESFDVNKEKYSQGELFYQKVEILKGNQALQELLRDYSINASDDLDRLAAVVSKDQAESFVRKTEGKRFVASPGEKDEFLLIEDNGIRSRSSDKKCWKGYVGVGAYSIVSGFYCSLTGPFAGPYGAGAAIAGDKVD